MRAPRFVSTTCSPSRWRRSASGSSPSRRAPRAPRSRRPRWSSWLKSVDDRQKNNGDWRAAAHLEQKEKDKVDVVYETEFYRRSRTRSS